MILGLNSTMIQIKCITIKIIFTRYSIKLIVKFPGHEAHAISKTLPGLLANMDEFSRNRFGL